MKVLVRERNGDQIKSVANYSEPSRREYCKRGDCFIFLSTFGYC